MTAQHAGTVSRIPGTIIEVDLFDDDIEYDDNGRQIPTGVEWLVYLPAGMQRGATTVGDRQTTDEERAALDPLLPRGAWLSLLDGETYPADDIDVSEARLISVPIAETAARMFMAVEQLNGPQSASEAIWMHVGDSRLTAIRSLLADTDPIAGELERPARLAALRALGVSEHEIEQAS